MSALILGATGAVGQLLLKELLNSSHFTCVGEFGRRTTSLETSGFDHADKLVQRTIDFQKLDEAGLRDEKWDVIFITMGTNRKSAGSVEQFRKIDQDYVVEAARAAKNPQHMQRVVYLSTMGANSQASNFYLRSKGETEERLASLGYSDTIVFQPGPFIQTNRSESRIIESVVQTILTPITFVTDKAAIAIPTLAKSICVAGELGSSALPAQAYSVNRGGQGDTPHYTVIPNKGAVKLAGVKVGVDA